MLTNHSSAWSVCRRLSGADQSQLRILKNIYWRLLHVLITNILDSINKWLAIYESIKLKYALMENRLKSNTNSSLFLSVPFPHTIYLFQIQICKFYKQYNGDCLSIKWLVDGGTKCQDLFTPPPLRSKFNYKTFT